MAETPRPTERLTPGNEATFVATALRQGAAHARQLRNGSLYHNVVSPQIAAIQQRLEPLGLDASYLAPAELLSPDQQLRIEHIGDEYREVLRQWRRQREAMGDQAKPLLRDQTFNPQLLDTPPARYKDGFPTSNAVFRMLLEATTGTKLSAESIAEGTQEVFDSPTPPDGAYFDTFHSELFQQTFPEVRIATRALIGASLDDLAAGAESARAKARGRSCQVFAIATIQGEGRNTEDYTIQAPLLGANETEVEILDPYFCQPARLPKDTFIRRGAHGLYQAHLVACVRKG